VASLAPPRSGRLAVVPFGSPRWPRPGRVAAPAASFGALRPPTLGGGLFMQY